jgi:hypothetical protein
MKFCSWNKIREAERHGREMMRTQRSSNQCHRKSSKALERWNIKGGLGHGHGRRTVFAEFKEGESCRQRGNWAVLKSSRNQWEIMSVMMRKSSRLAKRGVWMEYNSPNWGIFNPDLSILPTRKAWRTCQRGLIVRQSSNMLWLFLHFSLDAHKRLISWSRIHSVSDR